MTESNGVKHRNGEFLGNGTAPALRPLVLLDSRGMFSTELTDFSLIVIQNPPKIYWHYYALFCIAN
jgi:hypothetical protein